jgi:pullulanase/glycogen debranching enzyme
MRQVEQHLNSLGYDFVALFAPHVRYKSNAASIVLLRRMV